MYTNTHTHTNDFGAFSVSLLNVANSLSTKHLTGLLNTARSSVYDIALLMKFRYRIPVATRRFLIKLKD